MIIAASFDTTDPELWVNRALSYGDGLFETMRFNHNRIPLLEFHLLRLSTSLTQLQLNRFNRVHLDEVISDYPMKTHNAVMKLLVYRANQPRTYTPLTNKIEWLLTLEELSCYQSLAPLKLALSKHKIAHQPLLAGHKHLSRLEQVMLAADLNQEEEIDDLLIADPNNCIIETSFQNVVMIKGQRLFTPKLNQSGVNGVALHWLNSIHDIKSIHIKVQDLENYDGMMVCNSIRGFNLVESVKTNNNQCISFSTSLPIHDKITAHWDALFKS